MKDEAKTKTIGIRLTEDEYREIDKYRAREGFSNLSEFMRWCWRKFKKVLDE